MREIKPFATRLQHPNLSHFKGLDQLKEFGGPGSNQSQEISLDRSWYSLSIIDICEKSKNTSHLFILQYIYKLIIISVQKFNNKKN